MTKLVVIDLVPALLSWEGRDASGEPDLPDGADVALHEVMHRYRLIGVADGDRPGALLRDHLARHDLLRYFDSIGTSSDFGPAVTARVIRGLTRRAGFPPERSILVTARRHVAEDSGGVPVVFMEDHASMHGLSDAIISLEGPLGP